MSWEYRLASEFKKRNNKEVNPWITADVISPVWDEDKEKYVGELIISAYGGEVMLKSNMLEGNTTGLHEGMTVQLVGNVFSKSAGSQKMLVVGRSGSSSGGGAELAGVDTQSKTTVTAERDINKLIDDGAYLLLGVTAGELQNSPECVYDGNYIVVNYTAESNGKIYGMQIFGRLTGGSARVQYYYRYRPTGGWGAWFKVKNDYRGLLYAVDADTLHNEGEQRYSGGYTLSWSSSNPNSNFPFNLTLAYLDIDMLQYSALQSNGIRYRPYRQTFIPALPTHSQSNVVYTRVLRVITEDCTHTDGTEYHAGDVYDKTDWHRQITDTEYDALVARISALEELTGISSVSLTSLTDTETIEESVAEQIEQEEIAE